SDSSAARRGSDPPPPPLPRPPPRSACARSSLFSSIRRANSRSTSSRKASTSSSSYPRLPMGGFLNATLWTSAGVSGIETPRGRDAPRWRGSNGQADQIRQDDVHQHEHNNQQHKRGQI